MEDRLFELVREKNATALGEWLEGEGKGVNPNPQNDQGQTPLYWACESDDPALVQVLIDHGADVNAAESFGYSPLHLVAYLGHVG
jgi:ankyrin repeat protein